MGDNLMEFSMVDENEAPGDEENYQPPTIVQSPVLVHSILKQSNKDNLIQLFTPKPTHKNLKVKFQTPKPKDVTPTRYEEIRSLDEDENWVERTSVVTKQQHADYLEYGRDIVIELVDNLPVYMLSPKDNSVKTDNTVGDSTIVENISENQSEHGDSDPNETISDRTLVMSDVVTEVKYPSDNNKNEGEQSVQAEVTKVIAEGSKTEEIEVKDNSLRGNKDESVEIEKSPSLPTTGGSYNIDFDNLDNVNPFATKSAIVNSPVCQNNNASMKEDLSSSEGHDEDQNLTVIENPQHKDLVVGEEIDPFKPKSQLGNSPVKPPTDDSDSETEFQDALSDVEPQKDIVIKKESETSQIKGVPESMLALPENISAGTSPRLFDPESNVKLPEDASVMTSPRRDHSESTLKLPENMSAGTSPRLFDRQTAEKESALNEMTATQTEDIFSQSFDDIDPFKPAIQIPNSPLNKGIDLYVDNNVESDTVEVQNSGPECVGNITQEKLPGPVLNMVDVLEDIDPLKPAKQIVNMPDKIEEIDPFKPSKQILNTPDIAGEIDPFKPSQQIMNTPDKTEENNLFNPPQQIMNPPAKSEEIDPFKPSKQITNSPDKTEEIDPFKPSNQIRNSPDKIEEIDPLKPAIQMKNSPDKTEEIDALKSSNQIVSTLEKGEEIYLFKQSEQIISSLDKIEEIDPFKPSTQIGNSPDKMKNVDPFESSKQIMNSPDKTEEIDPFKSSTQIMNSSDKSEEIDSFKPSKQVKNSPDKIDPFKPSKQIVNTPDKSEEVDPFKPLKQITNSPDKIEEIDPFKPSKQITNSPDRSEEIDPFKPSKQITNSPDKVEEIDPFKPSKQIVNTPDKSDEVDPFKASNQIKNSPDRSEETDPFKPSKQIINTPDKSEEVDPFKSSSQIKNSPDRSEETDPFKPSKQVVNSPKDPENHENKMSKDEEINPFKCGKQLVMSPAVGTCTTENIPLEDIDPFKPKTQIMNSPGVMVDGKADNPFVTKSKITNSQDVKTDKSAPSMPELTKVEQSGTQNSEDSCSDSKQMIDVNEQPDTQKLPTAISQGFDIEDDQFKPATEIFSSPSAWDILEKFGSSGNVDTDLARQSLYVKFDPLVNLPLNDPRRASIGIRRSSIGIRSNMKSKQLRDLNPEESFLLLGTPPNQRSRRVTNLGTRAHSIPEEGTPKSMKAPVDLLFASPASKTVEEGPKENKGNVLPELSDADIVQVLQYTEADMQQLRHILTLEFQGVLMSKEKEWSKLVNDEKKAKEAEAKKLKTKQEELNKNKKDLDNIMLVVSEYEKIINQLIGEKEKNSDQFKESSSGLKKERDQALEDVQSLENSFADLHKRYEKLRAALEGSKKNEDILKKCVDDLREKLKKAEEKLGTLKKDAEEKLTKASQEIEKVKSEKETDLAKSEAALKRKEMQVDSLQKSYDQKVNENKELTDLCDQLIGKVGK